MQSLSNANFNMDMASKAAPKPMVSRRRALGDITNATNDDAKDVVAKKPQFIAPSNADIMDTQDNASVATDRTYMNRMCDDIDARDSDNPLLVASCVNEIYENFSIIEKEFRVDDKYMMKQDYINEKMRSILVDWLVRISYCERSNREKLC